MRSVIGWLRDASPISLTAALVVWAGVLAMLVPILGRISAGILGTTYVVWLGFAAYEVRGKGRGWWKFPLPTIAFAILVTYALVIYPFVVDEKSATVFGSKSVATATSAVFAAALIFTWDNISVAVARRAGGMSSVRAFLVYLGILAGLVFPPFALLFVHPRVVAVSKDEKDGSTVPVRS